MDKTLPLTDFGAVVDYVEDPAPVYGPLRRAPHYYAGETYGTYRGKGTYGRSTERRGGKDHPVQIRHTRYIQHSDAERNPNGSLPGIRDKAARRIIRAAFGRKVSRVEQGLRRTRALKVQAVEVIHDEHYERSEKAQAHRAKALLAAELAIHQPVYVPDQKTLRAMRTEKRKLARVGKRDRVNAAIENIIDAQANNAGA